RSLGELKPFAQFKTFIFGVARNLALNHIRDENRRKKFLARLLEFFSFSDTTKNSVRDASTSVIQRELESVVGEILLELSPEHREVLILRETLGLDYERISKILGCNLGTVKSRLARAREQFRKKLLQKGVSLK
ncbi:MAG: sigma-70 family RNA polymerase sigma factor, partial [Candidatus Hydrogenedentes bacterium]|nr:sigma-70 family RNA polymerase sigma factor [Candidatus Hydrogenedentota bacterium]